MDLSSPVNALAHLSEVGGDVPQTPAQFGVLPVQPGQVIPEGLVVPLALSSGDLGLAVEL